MNYRCLIIDHDDTTVDSTPSVHHKAHLEQMRRLGRQHQALTLQEWFKINYDPGLAYYLNTVLRLSKEEQELCYTIWREYTTTMIPPFFPGILKILQRFQKHGGIIVVVSHSEPDIIQSHYQKQEDVPGLMPDLTIGWTGDREKNKPSTWPIEKVLETYTLAPGDLLVVDDLKPGIIMARKAGVDSLGVGWSHAIEEIKQDIRLLSTYYAETVKDLEKLLFN